MAIAVAVPRPSAPARLYIGAVTAAGAVVLAVRLAQAVEAPTRVLWQATLVALAVIAADQFKLTLAHGGEEEHFTLTDAVWVFAIVLAAPGAPTLGAAAGAVVWQGLARVPRTKLLFNAAQVTLAVTAAELVWSLGAAAADEPAAWALATAAAGAAFVVNQTTVALVVALVSGERVRDVALVSLRFVLLQWLGNVSIGLLAVVAWDDHPAGIVLVAIPLGLLYLADREWVAGLVEREQMEDMARTAEGIARRPDPSARLPVAGREGRLLKLTAGLNRMLEQLEQASARQRHVMSDAARALDGPVRGVRSELARPGAGDDVVLRREHAVAHLDEAARVLARMEAVAGAAQPAAIRPAPVPLAPFLATVARAAHGALDGRLELAPVAEGAVARLHRRWAERALLSLLDNAAVHARGSRTVKLGVVAAGRGWRFEVTDHGGGVPIGHENAVFEPFYRLSAQQGRPGLGLALVRSVAEAHGGSAGVVNRPGVGATFWLCVPR